MRSAFVEEKYHDDDEIDCDGTEGKDASVARPGEETCDAAQQACASTAEVHAVIGG